MEINLPALPLLSSLARALGRRFRQRNRSVQANLIGTVWFTVGQYPSAEKAFLASRQLQQRSRIKSR